MTTTSRFLRTSEHSAVHVLERYMPNPAIMVVTSEGDTDVPFMAWLLHWALFRCGRKAAAYDADGAYEVGEFEDAELCRLCVRRTPEADRHRLFEHPVPQPLDD